MIEHSSHILMLYHHPFESNASTIYEHINSFEKYSKYDISCINTYLGFPEKLSEIKFQIIVIHYSSWNSIPDKFKSYIKTQKDSKIIAFFQDEHMYCKKRFGLIDNLNITGIFTMLDKKFHNIYLNHTGAKEVYHSLTGYVEDSLIDSANALRKPFDQRSIDIGYRARPLPYYNGRGAQEKTRIGEQFIELVDDPNLELDIKMGEEDRIYGKDWHRFIANCNGMLGVEAGTSIFDIDGTAEAKCNAYLAQHPDASFEEVHEAVLEPYEDKVFYRTISPRAFECAAFKTCMILFEGSYNGILEPHKHYIPLKKDFSNLDQVLKTFNDEDKRNQIVENAYEDLIASGEYSYKKFIEEFDSLINQEFDESNEYSSIEKVYNLIQFDKKRRVYKKKINLFINKIYLFIPLPIRRILKKPLKPVIDILMK